MPRLRLLNSAIRDIAQIARHIGEESGSARRGRWFGAELRKRCRELAALPGTLGRPRPELKPELRSIAFRNYVIFFRYRGDAIEVINILEGHRDLDAYFGEDGGEA